MPLLYICATRASSWSFTDSSLSTTSKFLLFGLLRARLCSSLAQSGHTFPEFLTNNRRGQPTRASSRHQQIFRQRRFGKLTRLGSKRSKSQHPYGDHDQPPHQAESAPHKSVNPAQPHFSNYPADNSGGCARQKNDCDKNG